MATSEPSSITSALPTVCGHFATLVELFQNLLANAIKFRGPTNPVVQVSCSDVGSDFQITVRDNGIGIDPSYHEQIFRVFQRLHSREEYSGTGIGLAICKRIAEHHGGRLWVESVLGRGAAFHVTFPKDRSIIAKETGPIQA